MSASRAEPDQATPGSQELLPSTPSSSLPQVPGLVEAIDVDAPPSMVGRYHLTHKLASGGFATVYLARAVGPGGFEKFFAIKLIHSHLADDAAFVEMFFDEARIVAGIDHPNVCSVFDFGESGGEYYLAMEYLIGEPLQRVYRHRFRDRSLVPPDKWFSFVARVVADAAEGLHAAHEATTATGEPLQVIHRDVAPANLFVRYDGHVKVVDFGIARAVGRLHSTATGSTKGHYAYMAPEQFMGQVVDRGVDIWALGVILWELLAGQRLFQSDHEAQTMFSVLERPIPPFRDLGEEVPPALEDVVRRSLVRDRTQRFSTARQVSQGLLDYLAQCRNSMSATDVADHMALLFPDGLDKKKKLLAEAAQLPVGAEHLLSASPSGHLPAYRPPPGPSQRFEVTHSGPEDAAGAVSFRESSADVPEPAQSSDSWPEDSRQAGTSPLQRVVVIGGLLFLLGLGAVSASIFLVGPSQGPAQGEGPAGGALIVDPGRARAAGGEPQVGHDTDGSVTVPSPPDSSVMGDAAKQIVLLVRTPDDASAEPPWDSGRAGQQSASAPPQRPPPPPVRAAAGRGTVDIATVGGWGQVFHRGKLLGPTPGRFTLPAGRQRLKVVAGDRSAYRWLNIRVPANGRVQKTVRWH